jgi:hypothetical protein
VIERPVFLVGAERSGTTLLRLMLSQHPRIAFANEFEILVDPIAPDGTLPDRDAFIAHLRRDRGFTTLKRLDIAPGLGFVGLANDLLEQYARAKGGEVAVTGATVHRHFDRLLHIWPDARFIHLIRDGRDVALSTIPMGWHGNLYSGIGLWIDAERTWDRLARTLPPGRHAALHYERLVAEPKAELTRLCDFLGLGFDPAMLRYDERSSYGKVNTASVGKWQRRDPQEVAAAESIAAPWLRANGYTLTRDPRPVGPLRRLGYQLQDRLARARFRRQRYSLRLWLEGGLARRLGGAAWRDDVRRREHAITNRHLR